MGDLEHRPTAVIPRRLRSALGPDGRPILVDLPGPNSGLLGVDPEGNPVLFEMADLEAGPVTLGPAGAQLLRLELPPPGPDTPGGDVRAVGRAARHRPGGWSSRSG